MMSAWHTALLMCVLAGGCSGVRPDRTTCASAARGELTAVVSCATHRPPVDIRCESITNGTATMLHFGLVRELTAQEAAAGDSDDVNFCIGLASFRSTKGLASWGAEFDSQMAVGVLVVNRTCWESHRRITDCSFRTGVLSSVLALPVLQESPDEEQFWTGDWPRGWVRTLWVSDCGVEGRWLSRLAGSSVERLHAYSSIMDFESAALAHMSEMKQLAIVRSALTTFHPDNFLAIPNLEELNLSRNVLASIPKGISRLKRLRILDVSGSMVKTFTIPTHELAQLTSLEELNFAKIYAFKESTLRQIPYLPNLKLLNLSSCRVKSLGVEGDPFKNFPALKVLDLSRNRLHHLGPRFMTYRHLTSLILNRNQLDEWPMLYKCIIDILDLSWNKLTVMKNLGLHSTLIIYLNVSMNEIKPWNVDDIFDSPVISSTAQFNINRNGDKTHLQYRAEPLVSGKSNTQTTRKKNDDGKLRNCSNCNDSITSDRSKSLPPKRAVVEVKMLDCPDCDIYKTIYQVSKSVKTAAADCINCELLEMDAPVGSGFASTLRSTVKPSSRKGGTSTCADCVEVVPSEEWIGGWVRHVNLALNNIHTVSPAMLRSFSALRSVDLQGNPFDCSECDTPRFAQWAHAEGRVNVSDRLRCEAPDSDAGRRLIDATGYKAPCLGGRPAVPVLAGSVIGTLLTLVTCATCVMYWYRSELAYIMHLFRLRRARDADHYNNYLYDAFVCYSGNDRAWVMRTLAPLLECSPEHYRLCLHDRDFALGSMIVENIVHSIERSRRTVIVLSLHFVSSKWCQWELDMANHKAFEDSRNFLILFQLERLNRQKLPRHLKFLMDSRTYLEWPQYQSAERAGKQVFRRLREALGPSIHQMKRESGNVAIDV